MQQSQRPEDIVRYANIGSRQCRVTYEIVKLDGGNTLVYAIDNLHGDGGWVDMLWVEAIAEPRHTSRDLVELDAFLAAICEACQS